MGKGVNSLLVQKNMHTESNYKKIQYVWQLGDFIHNFLYNLSTISQMYVVV